MRTFLIPLIASALAPFAFAAEPAPAPETSVAAPAEAVPYKPGDPAPAALLPTVWLRGEPVKAFEPGVTYVLVLWNTVGGHNYAPGYNIARTMKAFEGNPRAKGIVVFIQDDIAPAKLANRLARPSQQTPFPIGHAVSGGACEKAFERLFDAGARFQRNTLVVRDGRIVWVGEAGELFAPTLSPFLKADFNYEGYVKWNGEYQARTRELMKMLMTDLPAAEKAKDDAKVQSILRTIENEPEVAPYVYSRMCDALWGMAMEKHDLSGAIASMRKLSDKYPNDPSTQAWVHKVIVQTEELYKPGLALSAHAAERMARLGSGDSASSWWRSVAKYRRELGDKPGALAALEEAEKLSGPYLRLQAMKAASAK